MNPTAIAFLVISVIFFIAYFVISRITYKSRFKISYSIKNFYPYELNYKSYFKLNFWGNICLILSLITSILFLIFFDDFSKDGFLIFGFISGILVICFLALLAFVPLDKLKLHLASVVFMFTFSCLFPASIALNAINKFQNDRNNIGAIIVGLFAVLIAFVGVVLIFNPKLNAWAHMEKIENEDGTVTYKRPKYFALAFSEWLLFFSFYVSEILLLLNSLFK